MQDQEVTHACLDMHAWLDTYEDYMKGQTFVSYAFITVHVVGT